jgi:Flp pilus assembly CpaF family ATPase
VNGPDDVYVERKGRIERVADRLFEGEEAVLHVIERIVAPLGLRVDATSPWVDARLPDGSRVQTNFLNTPFLPSLLHPIQLPAVRELSSVRAYRRPRRRGPIRR